MRVPAGAKEGQPCRLIPRRWRTGAPRASSYADVVEKAQRTVVSVYPATLLKETTGDDRAFIDRSFGRKEAGEEEGEALAGGATRRGPA